MCLVCLCVLVLLVGVLVCWCACVLGVLACSLLASFVWLLGGALRLVVEFNSWRAVVDNDVRVTFGAVIGDEENLDHQENDAVGCVFRIGGWTMLAHGYCSVKAGKT